jgi:tRNA-specific 2-thiouridylase
VGSATLAPDVTLPLSCEVAVRYRGKPIPAQVQRFGLSGIELRFSEAAMAVVPGQVAVLYDGERVLGGGTIDVALPRATFATTSVGAPAS